jgi:hypothetical protein
VAMNFIVSPDPNDTYFSPGRLSRNPWISIFPFGWNPTPSGNIEIHGSLPTG